MVSFHPSHSSSDVASSQITSVNTRLSPWLTPLVYSLGCRVVMPLYFGRINIIGQENLPRDGAVILAPTHRARWDAVLVAQAAGRTATGRDLRYMVSADEVKGIQGWFIRRLGGFPINPRRPAIASLRHGVEILQSREMLVIFPEGGIFRDNQIHPLKPGLARLALQAESANTSRTSHDTEPGLGVKIVPMCIHYSEPYPGWGCDVNIQIGSPLVVGDYATGSAKKDAQTLTTDLSTALKTLNERKALESEFSMYANEQVFSSKF